MTESCAAATVYYDGGCPVCTREITLMKAGLSPTAMVHFVDVAQSTEPPAADLTREAALARFHVRRGDGTLVVNAAAFVSLWRHISWMRPLAIAVDNRPGLWLADLAYAGFLRIRKLWRKP